MKFPYYNEYTIYIHIALSSEKKILKTNLNTLCLCSGIILTSSKNDFSLN